MDNVIERLLKQKNERISDLENENKALGIINDEIGKLNKNLIEENKNLKEKLSEITMVSDDEKQSIEHVLELEEENRKLKRIIGNIVYLYNEEPTELEEYVKSGFKGGMSN